MKISFVALNSQEIDLLKVFLKADLENEVIGQTDRKVISRILLKLDK